jgi:ribosomal-protein-alanine N-acetyltransferase
MMNVYAAGHSMIIRSATEEDLDRVLLIESLSFGATWTPHCLKTALSDDIFLVYQQKNVIGYLIACLCEQGKKAEILRIAVHPNHRSKGIAKELLETSFGIFPGDTIEEVSLNVDSSNRAAVKLYEKLGFEIAKVNSFLGDLDFHIFYVMKLKFLERKKKEIQLCQKSCSQKADHAIH